MTMKNFIESYPLYTKYKINLAKDINEISMPKINLYCKKCESYQTFLLSERRDMYGDILKPKRGVLESEIGPNVIYITPDYHGILYVTYICASCECFKQNYSLKISDNFDYIMKIGQYPTLEINVDKDLKPFVSDHEKIYRKGLICEFHGYGIGAYAYYRRIVEEIIDDLLENIIDLIEDENKENYKIKLEEAKKSRIAKDKIDLVKGYLPLELRPNNMNPLNILHSKLSEGIHLLSDEDCLRNAKDIRKTLIFLVKKINSNKDSKEYLESMKNLLK